MIANGEQYKVIAKQTGLGTGLHSRTGETQRNPAWASNYCSAAYESSPTCHMGTWGIWHTVRDWLRRYAG